MKQQCQQIIDEQNARIEEYAKQYRKGVITLEEMLRGQLDAIAIAKTKLHIEVTHYLSLIEN